MRRKTNKRFHLRVRAVIRDGDRILLARARNENYTFLPGGHHEIGETFAESLVREIKEELGLSSEVQKYLGIVENGWPEDDVFHYEVNHVFELAIPRLNANTNPVSLENHLQFLWSAPQDFQRNQLLPVIVRKLLAEYLQGNQEVWYENNFE